MAAETGTELLEQGLAAGKTGRFDEAVAKFSDLIARSPKVPDASLFYIARADAYVHEGHYDLAWTDLAEAIALDPKHAKAQYLRGFILDERHDLQGAIEAYSKAIAIDPRDADSLYNRGVDFYQQA
jgi:tetratricopeptide (TPR) repeat protein